MSSTVKTVPPWEIAVLREVHGDGNVNMLREEEAIEHAQRLNIMDDAEIEDIPTEYERLAVLYGLHRDVKITNVEKVYGPLSDGRFERAVRAACTGDYESAEAEARNTPAPVPIEQLRDQADSLGIDWDPATTPRVLRALIADALEDKAAA
jgi:hypothetical protein